MMGKLEREIAAPDATPAQIIGLVSGMSSASVVAPRNLPTKLVNRLDDVAAQHAGTVQLHGRLFAQWMHHAFPRECPFPHVSGSTTPVTPDEWLDSKGNDGYATREEMLQYANKATGVVPQDLDWIDHEELLVPIVKRSSSTTHIIFLGLAAFGAAMAMRSVSPYDLVEFAIANLVGKDLDKCHSSMLPVYSGKSHML